MSALSKVGGMLPRGLRRGYASASSAAASTGAPLYKISQLSNGMKVATEHTPGALTATVGVWIDAGSRADTSGGSGAAHFLEHMAFKGTKRRTQQQLELEVESIGAQLNAYTSREYTVYFAKAFKSDVAQSVDIIADIVQNSTLDPDAIERERGVILREQAEVDKIPEEVVFDHLHATAFQEQPLGRTILGPESSIRTLSRSRLQSYVEKNYRSDRITLVGAGAVDHGELVALAEKHFSKLTPSPFSKDVREKSDFIGSEVRVRDDTMPTVNFALAFEGASWSSPDYIPLLVLQAISGNWDRSLGASNLLSSRLSHIVGSNHLANSFLSFSTSYSDTGLWGIYFVSENFANLDDLTYFTLKEWCRLATSPTEPEVQRAKAQLKAALLLNLDSSTAIAEDIGRQIVTSGRRLSPYALNAAIDSVTTQDIQRVAKTYLWDKDIAIAALGQTEGIQDYNRIRALTSSLLW